MTSVIFAVIASLVQVQAGRTHLRSMNLKNSSAGSATMMLVDRHKSSYLDSVSGMIAYRAAALNNLTLAEKFLEGQPNQEGCMPICRWKCSTPTCTQVCDPQCDAPRCETRCAMDTSGCEFNCQEPACAVVCPNTQCTNECPKCKAQCGKPKCGLVCGNPQPCKSVCEQPQCRWVCRAPEVCPEPQCEMACDTPKTCPDASVYQKMPELGANERVVSSYSVQHTPLGGVRKD